MVSASTVAAEEAAGPLATARQLYNQRQFDAAIAAADAARSLPGLAHRADLVVARAYLERHRETTDADDLARARERLRRIDPEGFNPRERGEYIVGLGAALYFEDLPGAAAAAFWPLLEGREGLDRVARDRLLDWWASALDRDARPRGASDRARIYQQVRDGMRIEIAANPASAVAVYWLAAAAAGAGDWQGAWDEAQAGWVRAALTDTERVTLRTDLDRLVRRAIAPERAQATGRSIDDVLTEWDAFVARWTE